MAKASNRRKAEERERDIAAWAHINRGHTIPTVKGSDDEQSDIE